MIDIKDIVTFVLTALGLVIAAEGLSTWKKQTKGVRQFDAAYNLHLSLLKLRDAVKFVRNPAIWPSESNEAVEYTKKRHPNKPVEEIAQNTGPHVYEMRWQKITMARTEVESHALAAEVLWGSEVQKKIQPMYKKVADLNFTLWQRFSNPYFNPKDMKWHYIIYDTSTFEKEDSFSTEVNSIVTEIGDYLRQKIG